MKKEILGYYIEMSLNYYSDNGRTVTGNDICTHQPMSLHDCNHFYFSNNPTGWYHDVGQQPIGKRPVRARYHVGNPTCPTRTQYVQPGKFSCYQPCWGHQCK